MLVWVMVRCRRQNVAAGVQCEQFFSPRALRSAYGYGKMLPETGQCEGTLVNPNPKPPGGLRDRLRSVRISRDNMILVAALGFLGLTILLAIFFPAAGPSSNPASVAQRGTAGPTAARPTGAASGTAIVPATPLPTSALAGATQSPDGYPGPETATDESAGNGSDSLTPGAQAQPSADLPTFSPNRPSIGPDGAVPTSGSSGYPPPQDNVQPSDEPPQNDVQPSDEPSTDVTDTPESAEDPTEEPTARPTPRPAPTSQPAPTERPSAGGSGPEPPAAPAPTPAPPALVDTLRGNIRWTAAQSPIIIAHDQQIAAGASLVIEPGVEVRLAQGVSFFVDGTLYALGQPGNPVRFVSSSGPRWEGLFGRSGSDIALEHTEIHGAGAGGTALTSSGGNLVLHGVHVNDSGGHIEANNSHVEMRDSEIAGNDMPYGAALDISYDNGGSVTLINNRIGGNHMSAGAPPVQITNQSSSEIVKLDIQRNLLIGQDGPDLTLSTNGPFQGGLSCNALLNGANGLSIRSQTLQIPGFNLSVHDNAIDDHTPPIIPIYLQYGIGRGATSEIALDMRNNWWGSPLGPYHPDLHGDGRGDAVGDNIAFDPWLKAWPACAPHP